MLPSLHQHEIGTSELDVAAVSAAGFEMLTKRMTREIASISNPRRQLFALLRAYLDHGVKNPALYLLMFGGDPSGPDHGCPGVEMRIPTIAARDSDRTRPGVPIKAATCSDEGRPGCGCRHGELIQVFLAASRLTRWAASQSEFCVDRG
jgi:hypothetical protein